MSRISFPCYENSSLLYKWLSAQQTIKISPILAKFTVSKYLTKASTVTLRYKNVPPPPPPQKKKKFRVIYCYIVKFLLDIAYVLNFVARDADEREKWIQGLENAIERHSHVVKVTVLILELLNLSQ